MTFLRRSLSAVLFVATLAALTFAPASFAGDPASQADSNDGPAYGPELQGFDYPYPVARFALTSQRQIVRMAYMDVHPLRPNGRTAVLLHGKNFCSATWRQTIETLTDAGYRVIAPDQIGFCKSTKPARYQYSFQQLARNTHALLEALNVKQATLIAHSTGGMLAVRYALMYPRETEQIVLVNPIGLEDWKAKGVPSISIDDWYARELKTSADGIRRYEQSTYYAGHWRADYEPWVQMLAGMYRGPGKDLVAWNSALLSVACITRMSSGSFAFRASGSFDTFIFSFSVGRSKCATDQFLLGSPEVSENSAASIPRLPTRRVPGPLPPRPDRCGRADLCHPQFRCGRLL